MTIEEKIREMLAENGIRLPGAVEEVMAAIKDDDILTPAEWRKVAEGYSIEFWAVLWLCVRRIVIAWIDENKPQAFYRSRFADIFEETDTSIVPEETREKRIQALDIESIL